MSVVQSRGFPKRWRFLGFLPVFFFLARWVYFQEQGGASQILWMCHLSNLTLGLGLLLNLPMWVGISAYWLVLAIPFWLIDVFTFGMEGLTSFATHVGGTLIAVLALTRIRPPRRLWFRALAWHLFLQVICRFFTPPELNINFSHAIYRGWEPMFPDYRIYWLLVTVTAALALYLLDLATRSLVK